MKKSEWLNKYEFFSSEMTKPLVGHLVSYFLFSLTQKSNKFKYL